MHEKLRPLYVWVAVAIGIFSSGCGDAESYKKLLDTSIESHPPAPIPVATPIEKDAEVITVASFNIQVFGTAKLKKTGVMDILASVVRRFDVMAIQEIRSKDQSLIDQFVQLINADGSAYSAVLGPRLGRSSSKEQYAFLFDTNRIEIARGSVETVADPDDRLHREPFVARFRVRGPPAAQAFSFKLINIHTDPDETTTELDALDDVFIAVQRGSSAGEDDVILLGDLNVDEHHLGELGALPQIMYVISGQPTNTRGNKSYDNILFDRRATTEFTGQGGVFNLTLEYQLSKEQALEVSDHFPVWAAFSVYEGGRGSLAGNPANGATLR